MRTLIISVLLASAAAPPLVAQDRGERGRDRDGAAQSSDDGEQARPRQPRSSRDGAERARPQRVERQRSSSNDGVELVRPQRAERQQVSGGPAQQLRVRAIRERRSRDRGVAAVTAPTVTAPAAVDAPGVRVVRSTDTSGTTRAGRTRRGNSIADQMVDMRRARVGDAMVVDRDRDRDRTTTPARTDHRYSGSDRRWDNHWRSDRRYDWRRHRDRHRSIYRFGGYYDPYGYSYRRFSIGFNLGRSYYGSRYWLNDPWHYRLPPAYGPYRWVRYWDDAVLVNVYTGQVVDVVHNFFW